MGHDHLYWQEPKTLQAQQNTCAKWIQRISLYWYYSTCRPEHCEDTEWQ